MTLAELHILQQAAPPAQRHRCSNPRQPRRDAASRIPNKNAIDLQRDTTRGNFATYSSDNISSYTAFNTEFMSTTMLVLSISAIANKLNCAAGPVPPPSFCLMALACSMNTNYAVNPAHDPGTCILSTIAGGGPRSSGHVATTSEEQPSAELR
ncbi:hypothetical protein PR003_g16175 [Phytophthora rubi]|uniref:Aquaporin n=1 Tax=Phytophthora rubi TaxID=129364 RepID=A0A6A4EQN5_9STRA|nr:hypothetical protein PR003_g16175 [Phytophthora rubi]